MKGDAKVVQVLNEALAAELTAISQYFIHSEVLENRGFEGLHEAIKAESMDEMRHAEKLIERILFFDAQPSMGRHGEIKVGSKVEEMLGHDLQLELDAVALYNRAIRIAGEANDNGTSDLLQKILADEERHVHFLETQLSLIQNIGIENYLSRQIGKAG